MKMNIRTAFVVTLALIILSCSSSQQPSETLDDGDDGNETDEGTIQLFFNLEHTNVQPNTAILQSATSTDGIHFTRTNTDWFDLRPDLSYSDPEVRLGSDSVWRLVAAAQWGERDDEYGIYLSTTTGEPVFPAPSLVVQNGTVPDLLEMPDGWRLFFCEDSIQSAFSSDGFTFTLEDGIRVGPPTDMAMACDPAAAKRSDGTYVMYFKAAPPAGESDDNTPYSHKIYRAFSSDGLTWTQEDVMLVDHASVPAAVTDANGRVWVYFLSFPDPATHSRETIWAFYENDDFSISTPEAVVFEPALESGYWTNDPSPVLMPPSQE